MDGSERPEALPIVHVGTSPLGGGGRDDGMGCDGLFLSLSSGWLGTSPGSLEWEC